jgi:hypothetical protein
MNRCSLLFSLALLPTSLPSPAGDKPALTLQQTVLEGLKTTGLDLKDPVAVFATVFAQLPGDVKVYPTENYYYWQLYCEGREIRGNIRLPSGQREKGILCLGYSEFDEFPADEGPEPEISNAKYFSRKDGVEVTCPDAFTSVVKYRDKSVTFHFHQLPQLPPKMFPLAPDEVFVERTCDESGFQFFLLFNTTGKYFLWILNEEVPVPDHFQPLAENALLGRRSGFLFWIDTARGGRKMLAAVREDSVARNDYFDGPFDQLADNYADQANVRKYIEEAIPSCRNHVDKWGYFTDHRAPKRVALNSYGNWHFVTEAVEFLEKARKSGDIRKFISEAGKD